MIFTIFKKELIDTLRDRRTVITMIVIPILLFPIILFISGKAGQIAKDKVADKILKVGIINQGEPNDVYRSLVKLPLTVGKTNSIIYSDTNKLKKAIEEKKCDVGFVIPASYTSNQTALQTAKVQILFKASDLGFEKRAETILEFLKNEAVTKRLAMLNLSATQINPLEGKFRNLASAQEVFGKLVGGIIPYLFVIFGFIGCMYPAIDLFTGEKERGTIETLLTAPIKRWQILAGKMGVVVLSGIAAATFALIGLGISVSLGSSLGIPAEIATAVNSILSIKFIIFLYLLLIPLVIFFAGVLVPICVYAKSFKEAQSMITPLNMVIILPAVFAMMPGIEYNFITALIPIVNIVLATKELIADTLDYGLFAISFGVMVLLAGLSIILSNKHYAKETNVVL